MWNSNGLVFYARSIFRGFKSHLLVTSPGKTIKNFSQSVACNTEATGFNVCVVGSGPAGFYTAQQILKVNPKTNVDIFEKLPCPYGLVRFGVAPDHKGVKNCINQFKATAVDERCRFFGNVNVGTDITTKELLNLYDACVLAYGVDDDRTLGISGEELKGVHSARAFIGWYNGSPQHSKLAPDLSYETACIIGQGNVALDVARILLQPPELLRHTDICEHALEALRKSKVKKVYLIGRGGPLQVTFTINGLREMVNIEGCKPVLQKCDFKDIRSSIPSLARKRRRLIELMCDTALNDPSHENRIAWKNSEREWHAHFCRSPVEIVDNGYGRVSALRVEINELREGKDGSIQIIGTQNFENIPCGLVLRSIGYKSVQIDEDIPFDKKIGIVPNINGRVVKETGSTSIFPGLYCSGWVKHGPAGAILTTLAAAKDATNAIVQDIQEGTIKAKNNDALEKVKHILEEREIKAVSFQDWEKIDDEEIRLGEPVHKPREKIVSKNEMLQIVGKL